MKINPELVAEVQRLSQSKTKQAAVESVLKDFVQRKRQLAILELAGTIDYDPAYDYKAARSRGYGKRRAKKSA
jgi:Arc/MetJ family transcription regulator